MDAIVSGLVRCPGPGSQICRFQGPEKQSVHASFPGLWEAWTSYMRSDVLVARPQLWSAIEYLLCFDAYA